MKSENKNSEKKRKRRKQRKNSKIWRKIEEGDVAAAEWFGIWFRVSGETYRLFYGPSSHIPVALDDK